MRSLYLVRDYFDETWVLNPVTGNMLVNNNKTGDFRIVRVYKPALGKYLDDALGRRNGWRTVFHDENDPPYQEPS